MEKEPESEYSQSTTITFEWTLRGLKNLFESSKGDTKSKTTKSMRFGDGRWQILFYANAGITKEGSSSSDGGGYVSLYLSCEPTQEERDAADESGKWVREGIYKFTFELKNLSKTTVYNMKEANNHTFSYKTANWGWAQFAKRDNIYFNSNGVKNQDAFIILCTITSSPAPAPPPPAYRIQSVPKRLLETVGALLDDPLYSDVEFVIPGRRRDIKSARKILASRTLLRRADYFESMFGSGFAEGSTDQSQPSVDVQPASSIIDSEAHLVMNEFEDSDEEDEGETVTPRSDPHVSASMFSPSLGITAASVAENTTKENNKVEADEEQRNVRAKLAHPSSPRSDINQALSAPVEAPNNTRVSIVVKDVAYATYMALLYYLYTDIVIFAPLSSTFIPSKASDPATDNTGPSSASEEASEQMVDEPPASRYQWIQEWKEEHPNRPVPCSAKAMYRLADRLDLPDLKARASQHIIKSLTVENIAYEIFTPFAAAFQDIRKVEVDFFLAHWKEIRSSDAMRNVWQQIRNGRHPGFEEVWPVIASNLEFKTSPKPTTSKSPGVGGDVTR